MWKESSYWFLLCVLLCTQGTWSKNIKRQHAVERIIGGEEDEIENFAYMAYLEIETKGKQITHCGGAIISNYSIVTAAHCLVDAQTVKARIGSSFSDRGGIQYRKTNFNQHPSFDNATHDYDIGIVNVPEGMALNGETASAVKVTSISNDPPEGEYMLINGWGPTEPQGGPSEVLQGAKIPVVDRMYCEHRIRGITRRMFCAGNGDINSCREDYGGPAVGENSELKGVASFGVRCGFKGYPTVYTRIGHAMIRPYIRTMTGV